MTCPVCKDDYSSTENDKKPVVSSVCGHGACADCFYRSLGTSKLCMFCRTKITGYTYNYQLMDGLGDTKTADTRIDEHMLTIGRRIVRDINEYVEENYPKGIYKYGDTPYCYTCRQEVPGARTVDAYLKHAYKHVTDRCRFNPF